MAALTDSTVMALTINVRSMLNQPDETNSFWTNFELRQWMNEAIRIYFAEITSVNEGQFTQVVNLDIVSGQEEVTLPTDFFEIRTVYKKVNDGYIALNYDNSVTSNISTVSNTGSLSYLPSYRLRNEKLVLNSPPQFNEVAGLRVEYIQFPEELATGLDTMQRGFSPVFKHLIEMYTVYKAKLKESIVSGQDLTGLVKNHLDELTQQFKEVITDRSKYPQFVIPFSPEE